MTGTYFILMSLLSLCGVSQSQDCRQGFLENVDFPGTDITYLNSPDADHCQHLCTQHPTCRFFTFVRADWTRDRRNFFCYLKYTPSGQPNVKKPLQGVTSGFSFKNCNPDPEPCLPHMYQDVDFYGADFRQTFTSDPEACQRVCTEDYACQFFTFVEKSYALNYIRYKCHLKFSWPVPRVPKVEAKAGVVSGFSHRIQIGRLFKTTVCEGKLFPNVNIRGFKSYSMPAASAEHCLALCSAYPRCTYFSYVRNNFKCNLKYNTYKMPFTPQNGVTSGVPSRFCLLDDTWVKQSYIGVNFPKSNIRYLTVDSSDMCQKACTEDPNCQFYSYFTLTFRSPALRRRCYLKRSITMPAPPKVKKVAKLVSGFSLKNCF